MQYSRCTAFKFDLLFTIVYFWALKFEDLLESVFVRKHCQCVAMRHGVQRHIVYFCQHVPIVDTTMFLNWSKFATGQCVK